MGKHGGYASGAWLLVAACGGSPDDPAEDGGPTTTITTTDPSDPSIGPGDTGSAGSGPVPTGMTSASTTATTAVDGTESSDESVGEETMGPPCDDRCPAPNGGIEWDCQQRFAYGVNYAWHHFAGDFGGIPMWNQLGVSGQPELIGAELQQMRDAGVSVIRWWVLPDFRGAGVAFDGSGTPTGLSGTMVADLETALELAAQADVYLMPCLFSFDNFRPDHDLSGLMVRGIQPIVIDPARRAALMENVVRPIAQTVAAHTNADRVIAWDIINEPEWAMSGTSPYGDMPYTPNPELQTVDHAQMETFVAETIAVLRQESDAMVTVGGAAMKWAKAWSQVDVDFYQFHIYDWVDQYWPYDMSPADYDVDDKPVVMGEFPLAGLASASYGQMLSAWWDLGYAGAMGWHFDEATPDQLDAIRAFAEQHACEASF